ncbi:MAG: universal stress protein [Halobacteria archaeon]
MAAPKTSSFRSILAAVDGSEPAVRAAAAAVSLARETGASLTFVSVVHVPAQVYNAGVFMAGGGAFDYSEDLRQHLLAEARKVLDRVADLARRQKVEAETRIQEGHVPTQILKFAEKGKFDLLVVGSRGLSGIGRLFLGSVSGAVVHEAKVSVLVVK